MKTFDGFKTFARDFADISKMLMLAHSPVDK